MGGMKIFKDLMVSSLVPIVISDVNCPDLICKELDLTAPEIFCFIYLVQIPPFNYEFKIKNVYGAS